MSSAINQTKRSHRSHMMHYSGAKSMKRAGLSGVTGLAYGDGALVKFLRAFERRGRWKDGDGEA